MSILIETIKKGCEYIQDIPPVNPKRGMTWKDTSFSPAKVKVYAGSQWVEVTRKNIPLTADFAADDTTVVINQSIYFTDNSIGAEDIIAWQWDFGDGNTTTVQNPVYSYAATGNYTITLTVTDEFGSDTQIKTNYITISANGTGYEYGYAMGGVDGSNHFSTVDRIIFPFDSGTATHVGNLSGSRCATYGCNSSNYGYCMGGWDRSNSNYCFSTIDRITFPFDSGIATHVGNLSGGRSSAAGCNSSNYGYCMSGYDGSNRLSTIDRITFPFDSGTATYVGNLSGSRRNAAGCNSSNYGYSMGGYSGSSNLSIIDRVTFPFNSGTATHVGNLSASRRAVAGCDGTDFVTLFV